MRELIHAHDQTIHETYHATALRLQEQLASRSGGTLHAQIVPNAELGSELDMLESLGRGQLDVATVTAPNAAILFPELQLLSLPYLFNDAEHFRRSVLNQEFRRAIDRIIRRHNPSLQCISVFTPGPRNIYDSQTPIEHPRQLSGLTLRVMASPVEARLWSSLDVHPLAMPFAEIHSAFTAGSIEAAEDTATVYLTQKHFLVAPFHMLSEHQWSLALNIARRASLQLPGSDELQESEFEALWRDIADTGIDGADRSRSTAMTELHSRAEVTVVEFDRSALSETFLPWHDVIAAETGMEAVLEIIRQES